MKLILFIAAAIFPVIAPAQNNLQQLFEDCRTDGSITLYHLESDSWMYSDSSDARAESLPASTFKILNSTIALEEGVISSKYEILNWDGTENTFFGTPVDAWNEDTDMEAAFKNSTVWFYVELAKRIGREKYETYLREISYGNGDLSEPGDDFWNYGSFGVSPVNQVTFLKAFYLEELSYSPDVYQTVKDLMISETADHYTLSGKTGWTKTETEDIGWWIGYSESENDTWFFATRLTKNLNTQNRDFSSCRMKITRDALQQVGAIEPNQK